LAIKAVMKATATGRQPHFVQGFLQIDDDLAAVGKGQSDHAANTLVVDVGIGVVVQAIATNLYASEQALGLVHEFKVGHYNRCMLKVPKILVTTLALVGCAVVLSACGQKGPLKLPDTPASAGRATLPQSLNPWHTAPQRTNRPSNASGTAPAAERTAMPDADNDTTPSASFLKP
jgi:predicted small lipoprotein YifL